VQITREITEEDEDLPTMKLFNLRASICIEQGYSCERLREDSSPSPSIIAQMSQKRSPSSKYDILELKFSAKYNTQLQICNLSQEQLHTKRAGIQVCWRKAKQSMSKNTLELELPSLLE